MEQAKYPHDALGKTDPADWTVVIINRTPADGRAEWLTFSASYKNGTPERLENIPFERGYQIAQLQMWLANRDGEIVPAQTSVSQTQQAAA